MEEHFSFFCIPIKKHPDRLEYKVKLQVINILDIPSKDETLNTIKLVTTTVELPLDQLIYVHNAVMSGPEEDKVVTVLGFYKITAEEVVVRPKQVVDRVLSDKVKQLIEDSGSYPADLFKG